MNITSKMTFSCFFILALAACKNDDQEDERPATWTTEVRATFDPAAGNLPEGLTVKDGFAYAGFAPLGEVSKVDLATGSATSFGKVPKPVSGKGFMTGLAFGPDAMLYVALVSFDPSVQPGIYRIPAGGGEGTLFAKDPNMVFPNGLVFDPTGALFVTDSAAGAVYQIARSGEVTRWASGELLAGDQTACGGSGNSFNVGANGLALRDGVFYVTNTDKGSIVRIADGKPELLAGPDCTKFAGADGLTIDANGNLVIALNRQNTIIRRRADGTIDVVASGLDFPASVTYDGDTLIATNFALANASSGKPAKPGLVAINAKP